MGEVTKERADLLRECDEIVVGEIKKAGLYQKIWQSFAVLLPVMSVGVMGDQRTYAYTCAVRAVHSEDGMTADWVPLPYEVLKTISNRIVNEVRGVNRVVYDITSKPPGTIEWESQFSVLSKTENKLRMSSQGRSGNWLDVYWLVPVPPSPPVYRNHKVRSKFRTWSLKNKDLYQKYSRNRRTYGFSIFFLLFDPVSSQSVCQALLGRSKMSKSVCFQHRF